MEDLYRRDFPPAARAKVNATKILATRDFEERQNLHRVAEIEAALHTYILQVFLSFAAEALELGRKGVWSADRVEGEAREFLRRTTIEAGAEKGFERSGHQLPAMISNWGGAILPEVQREFEKSAEWKRFRDGLLEVAELQADRATPGSRPGIAEAFPRRTGVAATAGVQKPACPDPGEAARPLLNVDLINQWIVEEEYSDTELAKKLHLSVRAVSSMRNNRSYHGRSAVQKLANLMGRDATELYLP